MPVTYKIGDRVVTPDLRRIGKIKYFVGSNKACVEFEDKPDETKVFYISAINKA